MKEEILSGLEARLNELEEGIIEESDKLGGTFELARVRASRDRLLTLLGELRDSTGDRFDALRMGLESAWEELRATLELEQDADVDRVTARDRLSVLRMGLVSAWDELRAGFSTAFPANDASNEAADGRSESVSGSSGATDEKPADEKPANETKDKRVRAA